MWGRQTLLQNYNSTFNKERIKMAKIIFSQNLHCHQLSLHFHEANYSSLIRVRKNSVFICLMHEMVLSWVKNLSMNLMLIFIRSVPKISFGDVLDDWNCTHNHLADKSVHLRKSWTQTNKLLLYFGFMSSTWMNGSESFLICEPAEWQQIIHCLSLSLCSTDSNLKL